MATAIGKRPPLKVHCAACEAYVYRCHTTGLPEICFECAPNCEKCGAVMTAMRNGGWHCFQC